jgi:hypothetical protein
MDQPIFDVDLYRYVARVSAKAVETKDYALQVTFVGNKNDKFITPFIMRSLKQAKSSTKYLGIDMYADKSSSPNSLRKKIVGLFPTLIIGEDAFAVKSKNAEDGSGILPYIEDNNKQFDLPNEDAFLRFIAEKSGLKPEILGFDTGFQRVDDEVQKIADTIRSGSNARTTITSSRNIVQSLALDETFKALATILKKLEGPEETDGDKALKRIQSEFEEKRKSYTALKTEYVTEIEHMEHLTSENAKGTLDFNSFDAARVKSLFNKNRLEEQLIELQEYIKGDLSIKIRKKAEETESTNGKEKQA